MFTLNMIKSSLGMDEKPTFPTYHDLDHLAGTWTKKEQDLFFESIKELEEIDKDMWE